MDKCQDNQGSCIWTMKERVIFNTDCKKEVHSQSEFLFELENRERVGKGKRQRDYTNREGRERVMEKEIDNEDIKNIVIEKEKNAS